MKHRTEDVYDELMAPLVTQLIELAKTHGIPLVLSAGMLGDDGDPLMCTTLILHGPAVADHLPGVENRFGLASQIFRGHPGLDTAAGLKITRHHAPRADS